MYTCNTEIVQNVNKLHFGQFDRILHNSGLQGGW